MGRSARLFILAVGVLAACGAPTAVPDAGHPMDSGAPYDAGVPLDSGAPDAGPIDAGPIDAGPIDAGPIDAGPIDAGAMDAGPIDAGPFDAGVLDAIVTVDLSNPGAPVPDDFIGLSVEWSHVIDFLGQSPVPQLLQNFAADGHHPVLRIGGNSEDQAYWNPDGGALPSGATVSLDGSQLAVLSALSTQTGAHFILGLNLARNDPANAAALVQAALGTLPTGAVDAFELGNEPDLYALTGARPIYYSQYLYQPDFDGYFPALSNAAGNQPLFAAPAIYGTTWFSWLPGFFSAEAGRLGLVTVHHYPYNVCLGTTTAPAIADLFKPAATTDYATTFAPVVQSAATAQLKLRVAEMNSISCGGVAGVSDTFAAGLWATDAMFELASGGAGGVNLHSGGHYAVFDFTSSGTLEVRGLYYGLLLFSRATAQQGRWLGTTVQSPRQVRAWSTLGSDGVARVALINEDLVQSASVAVTLPGRTQSGSLWRLTAPALDTATQISFGAQTFDGSTDGLPSGSATPETPPMNPGTYYLVLAPGSAALLAAP